MANADGYLQYLIQSNITTLISNVISRGGVKLV